MQLFGLVNGLLHNYPATSKRHLTIKRYSVLPLSPTTGLIGWVPRCETLDKLITAYRKESNPPIHIKYEMKDLDERSNDQFVKLKPLQKVEIFMDLMNNTEGNDLANIMWLQSPSSEKWLEKRTNYCRSLATMSMVGYILGLGDRHPCNIMMDLQNGQIVHIDFGDCFEVTIDREKYPERVPFRLTRMLVNAMEISGIEGMFRTTCELVMQVLRQHRDSLMAVLEAFVHDPLINWRLVTNKTTMQAPVGFQLEETIPDLKDPSFTKRTLNEFRRADTGEIGSFNDRAIYVTNRVNKN